MQNAGSCLETPIEGCALLSEPVRQLFTYWPYTGVNHMIYNIGVCGFPEELIPEPFEGKKKFTGKYTQKTSDSMSDDL